MADHLLHPREPLRVLGRVNEGSAKGDGQALWAVGDFVLVKIAIAAVLDACPRSQVRYAPAPQHHRGEAVPGLRSLGPGRLLE